MSYCSYSRCSFKCCARRPLELLLGKVPKALGEALSGISRVVKNNFLLRISIVCLQRRWRRRKNPHRIAEDTAAVFSSSPPRFVKTLKMLTTEPFFTTLLEIGVSRCVRWISISSELNALTIQVCETVGKKIVIFMVQADNPAPEMCQKT